MKNTLTSLPTPTQKTDDWIIVDINFNVANPLPTFIASWSNLTRIETLFGHTTLMEVLEFNGYGNTPHLAAQSLIIQTNLHCPHPLTRKSLSRTNILINE